MKYLLNTLLFCSFLFQLNAQNKEIPTYENLTVKKTYNVSISSSKRGGYITYEVDGVKVKKDVYQKYKDGFDNMEDCCPCILKTYDKDEVLLKEAVQCSDCVVGYLKEFYPNGKVKILGHYKENTTGDWFNIFYRGYCYVQDGDWFYYDEYGNIVKIETWRNGEFIEQKPKGKKPEAWKAELLVNGEMPRENKIYIDELEDFEIILYYKNESRFKDLAVQVSLAEIGKKKKSFNIPFKDLNAQEIKRLVSSIKNDSSQSLRMDVTVLNGEEKLKTMYLEVITE
ncbi:MAG: hypothetical protein GC192_19590 [Bacteroidetes bacterium]|nr:hypothetical protein [Bacteroidota bacterium]